MFESWHDFYLLIGSAAAALIGLLFVVATLTAGIERSRAQRGETLFMTPTVFHFAIIVVISAVAMAPHEEPNAAAALVAAAALTGLVYIGLKATALSTQGATEHWTDRWLYGVAPVLWYCALAAVALAIQQQAKCAPSALAALIVILLLLAIRNAWDLVTWIAPRVETLKDPATTTEPNP